MIENMRLQNHNDKKTATAGVQACYISTANVDNAILVQWVPCKCDHDIFLIQGKKTITGAAFENIISVSDRIVSAFPLDNSIDETLTVRSYA